MKQIYKIKISVIALAALFMLSSCDDSFLETTPTGAISEETVSSTLDGLYIALNGIHRKMVSQDLGNQGLGGEPGFIIGREAHGDDMTWDTQTWHQTHHTWAINTNASSAYNYGVWNTYYQFILNANKILENLETKYAGSTEPLAAQIKGECLAIRGWAHFQLVQYYAKRYAAGAVNNQLGVPYRESSEVTEMARNTVEEVYTKINRDLTAAATLLEGYNPAVNHYSPAVVAGLRARVALTQQNYLEAATQAVLAINLAKANGKSIMKQAELMNGFANITTATKEALYAAITQDDQTVYFYSFYAYMSWNFNSSSIKTGIKCISQSTYDLMSPTDLRRQWWDPTGTAAVPTVSTYNKRVYQNRKFTARSTADAVGDFAFMRISELYLIAAEAYARSGQDTPAKTYLQELIAERDPGYTDSGNTGTALAEEVMNHRRIELWGEGFRWFDLKRLNLPLYRTGSNFKESFCGFLEKQPTDNGWYYEIPKAETDYNTLMEKNY